MRLLHGLAPALAVLFASTLAGCADEPRERSSLLVGQPATELCDGSDPARVAEICDFAPGSNLAPRCLADECAVLEDHVEYVEAIADAAVAHFHATGELCGDAAPVPITLSPTAYMPNPEPGMDFQRVAGERGWVCLGFRIDHPIRYAYAYRVTGAFSEGLAGAPALEGTYFEASARADLDYDGQSSIYAVVGTVGADGAIAIVRYERFAGE